jgi:hypothetical protein
VNREGITEYPMANNPLFLPFYFIYASGVRPGGNQGD